MKRSRPNTRAGGCAVAMVKRDIIADPDGNREQRRAAKKLGIGQPAPAETAEPTCPHCGRTSHGFACPGLMGVPPIETREEDA